MSYFDSSSNLFSLCLAKVSLYGHFRQDTTDYANATRSWNWSAPCLQRSCPLEKSNQSSSQGGGNVASLRNWLYHLDILLVPVCFNSLIIQVDDKYQYACEDKDNKVVGWISFDPPIGMWVVTPSDEFRLGGPVKQDLTAHVGPTLLAVRAWAWAWAWAWRILLPFFVL